MRKIFIPAVSFLIVFSLLLAPMQSGAHAIAAQMPPGRELREVPQEVRDAFRGGMTVEEFLSKYDGPIPAALWNVMDEPISVIVEMEKPALSKRMVAGGTGTPMRSTEQKQYTDLLRQAQAPLVTAVQARGGSVLGQYTRVYNGVLVRINAREIDALRQIAGVKAVHRAPRHKIDLMASVPLIGAPNVWNATPTGYDGSGVRIAIIDTGIDYTHASFGGPGTPSAYAGNNPRIVEAGSFPTAKVIGGYDFAGTNYNASDPMAAIPAPDADPLDENGHGTHVASIAAGLEVKEDSNVLVGAGVAPGASLYALKVFGASGSTDLVINALEWAMDPNGDGDLSDRVDVINMSLGSIWGVASADDPEQVALNLISSLGTVVVTSAGNEGDSSYITGAPAVADAAISVAATTTGFVTMPKVQYNSGTQQVPYQPANPFDSAITATLVDVDVVDGIAATGELCTTSNVTAGALAGAIALIQRGGGCTFETKINNAAALGATGAIIYNQATAADEFVSMVTGTATLPAGHTLRSYGLILKGSHNTGVTVGPDSQVVTFAWGSADAAASFTSRGPRGYDSKLKPELSAPGVSIYAAAMGSGKSGIGMSGTSMAAPHVTGVAALVRQAHPGWNPEKVKAALMSTAVDVGGDVPLTGAGRVDAEAAVFTKSLATGDVSLVSLSWGLVQVGEVTSAYVVPEAKQVRLENLDTAQHTYNVSVQFSDSRMTGATLGVPTSVTVPAGGTVGVPVTLTLDPALLPVAFDAAMEEYDGFITFTPQDGGRAVRLPFYFVPRPYSALSEVSGAVKNISVVNNTPAQVTYTNTGPATASLWAWPALVMDGNEPEVNDMADLRAAGIDYVGSGVYGDILGVGIAKWGAVHTLQPYFDETDLMIDANRDGTTDYVLWNFNYGWVLGGDETNDWIVLLTDLTVSAGQPNIFLASPYLIYGDFNSGLSEWYVPVNWIPLSRSDFGYQFFSFDSSGAMDSTPAGVFDYMRSPFVWYLSDYTPSTDVQVTLKVGLKDAAGFWLARPKGMMVMDYYGKPGAGQAILVPLGVEFFTRYLPFIAR